MKKQDTDKSFLQDIASMKKMITIQKEDNGIVNPIEYQAVSFNIPELLFWNFKKYALRKKDKVKSIFNNAIDDFLNNRIEFQLDKWYNQNNCVKYNIKIRTEYIEKIKMIAINNRLNQTDIYVSIINTLIKNG